MLPPSALLAFLTARWPAAWSPRTQGAAARAGDPVAALASGTAPLTRWEATGGVDPPARAPKLLSTLATPNAKAATVALEQAFTAQLATTLLPTPCASPGHGSAWLLDGDPESAPAGYYRGIRPPHILGGHPPMAAPWSRCRRRADALGREAAFQAATGYAPAHIIHYDPAARYTAKGTLLE